MMNIRRVVTGLDADGRSVVTSDEPLAGVRPDLLPGARYFLTWGTPDGGAIVGAGQQKFVFTPYFPGPGGTRITFLRFEPESAMPEVVGDRAALIADLDSKLPGLREPFVHDDPAMHGTDTVDYGVCLEGEMWMELDGGEEVHLIPGTCVVQRGTVHAWHNRGQVAALMLFVLVGAERRHVPA